MADAVHPRACGEHCFRRASVAICSRFIPARAGNTGCDSRRPTVDAVHPRACGEHSRTRRFITHCAGSSPRVRGTRMRSQCDRHRVTVHPRACGEHIADGAALDLIGRFIPARAGNTQTLSTRPSRRRGSSPRVRGTRSGARGRAFHPSVHPRACGEHAGADAVMRLILGSSPRVRGTRGVTQVSGLV